jgi:hypothetical protein
MKKREIHIKAFFVLTLLLAAVMPFSARLTTWCIILLALNWLMEGDPGSKLRTSLRHPVAVLCMLFYALEICGLLHTRHLRDGFYHAQNEASFLVFPLLFCCYPRLPPGLINKVFAVFSFSVLLSSLYCLCVAFIHYVHSADVSFFFYHTLVAPVHQHAVYFSMYVFICIVWLFKSLKATTPVHRRYTMMLLLGYFGGLLFLLRSKILVAICMLYFVYQLAASLRRRPVVKSQAIFSLGMVGGICIALCTANPLSHQFSGLRRSDLNVLRARSFDPGDYFDEVQLRLLLWKFTLEILHESHSWLLGVSPGDARYRINRKVVSQKMYVGVPGTPDHGYLNYNVHNQYLETLLRSGLIGLTLLLLLLSMLVREAIIRKDDVLFFLVLTFAIVFLTESVLERQFGIVPFLFFTCLLVTDGRRTSRMLPRGDVHE